MDCRYCGELLGGDPERIGARCPRCREPLYEKPDQTRKVEPNGAVCAVHIHNVAVNACARCGAALCVVCRTRWFDKPVCVACLEKAMGVKQIRPDEVTAQRRQALAGLILAAAAWVLVLVAGIPLLSLRGDPGDQGLLYFAIGLALASLLPGLYAVGQAAAAVRVRGDRLALATVGLCLSGVQVGAVLGGLLFLVWNR